MPFESVPLLFTPRFCRTTSGIAKNWRGIFEFHLILYLSRAFLKKANKVQKNGFTGNEPGVWAAVQSADCA
jgi:hypothetical protein